MAVLRILLALAMHTEMKSAWDCRDDHYRRTPREGPNYDPGNAGRDRLEVCKCEEDDSLATLTFRGNDGGNVCLTDEQDIRASAWFCLGCLGSERP